VSNASDDVALPDDVLALLREAARAQVVTTASKDAAWAAIESTVGAGVTSATMGAATTSLAWLGLVAAGLAAIALAIAAFAARSVGTADVDAGALEHVEHVEQVEHAEHAEHIEQVETPVVVDAAVINAPATTTTAVAARAPQAPVAPTTPSTASAPPECTAERATIEDARERLARGDLVGASAAIDDHRQRFAHCALSEDREALAVMLAWRRNDADAANIDSDFQRRYPHSIYRAAIARQRVRTERGP
jgi:hypothetical protein